MKRTYVFLVLCLPLLMGKSCPLLSSSDPEPAPAVPTDIQVEPAYHDFDVVTVGSLSVAQVFTITAASERNLDIQSVAVTGSHSSAFRIEVENCSAQTLTPLSTCTIAVTFRPMTAGAMTGELTINSSDSAVPTLQVPLRGTAVGQ